MYILYTLSVLWNYSSLKFQNLILLNWSLTQAAKCPYNPCSKTVLTEENTNTELLNKQAAGNSCSSVVFWLCFNGTSTVTSTEWQFLGRTLCTSYDYTIKFNTMKTACRQTESSAALLSAIRLHLCNTISIPPCRQPHLTNQSGEKFLSLTQNQLETA